MGRGFHFNLSKVVYRIRKIAAIFQKIYSGLDLPPGNYIVRIKGDNGEEATMPVKVPEMKRGRGKSQIESSNRETRLVGCIILTVEQKDQTKRSLVLREPDETPDLRHVSIDDATINKIKQLLAIGGKEKVGTFADKYVEDHRQEIEFFNDIVTLSRSLESSRMLKIYTATDLLYNDIMAQIVRISCPEFIARVHEIQYNRLTQQSHKSFVNAIKDDFEDAEKVGVKKG